MREILADQRVGVDAEVFGGRIADDGDQAVAFELRQNGVPILVVEIGERIGQARDRRFGS